MNDYSLSVENPDGTVTDLYVPYDYQRKFHASTVPNLLALGTRNTGKAIALDTPIPTPQGYRLMQDLAVGDCVFDETGQPTRIVWKSEEHTDLTGTYQLTFDDGSQIICGGQHQWLTLNKREATSSNLIGSVKTTTEIAQTIKVCRGRETNHRVPIGGSWQITVQDLPIDPYVLGVWLGDGNKGVGQITSNDAGVIDQVRAAGYTVKKLQSAYHYVVRELSGQLRSLDAVERTRSRRALCAHCGLDRYITGRRLCDRCYWTPEIRREYPKEYKGFKRFSGGVLLRKRIPEQYLLASREQRLSLLQGLMDTDGYCCSRQGTVEFCNTNADLARGVLWLARSLGAKAVMSEGRATLYGKDCGPKYRVCWTSTLPVFRLHRKLRHVPKRCSPRQSYRYIVNAVRIEDRSLQCLQVEASSHLYLVGQAGIPTHNSLSLRFDAILRCLMVPNFRALIIRRTMPELRESHLTFIDYETKLLGGVFLSTFSLAKFPNGSTIKFGHCETEADVMNFLSTQYGAVYFDELSTFSLEQFLKISTVARGKKSDPFRAVVRAGSNPLGIGSDWMQEWFINKDVRSEDYPDYIPDDYEMQFSTLDQNTEIDAEAYKKRLRNLPEHVRRAWLLGEFVMEGAYFSDFWPTKDGHPWHVIDNLPTLNGRPLFDYSWLSIYRAIDWGYWPDPAVCLWIAVLPNKRAVVFKERTWHRTLAADVAKQIKKESEGMHIVETHCDPSMFIKTGVTIYSIGELFEQNGVPLTQSVNKRELFGYSIHNYLNTIIDELPQVQIVKPLGIYGCPNLIRTLPRLRMDPADTRKIAAGDDHHAVALAYFCMSSAAPSNDPIVPVKYPWMQPKRRARMLASV